MNWDQIEGNWEQFKARIKQKWARRTDDDLHLIHGKRIELSGKIQERQGITEDHGEKQFDAFEKGLRI